MESDEQQPPNEVADYDYSDAPGWALPREWYIDGTYGLDNEDI